MTDQLRTIITDSSGAVNAGSGVLNVYQYGTYAHDRERWNPRRIAEDDLVWLYDRFVQPPGYRDARNILMDRRTVLLSGQAGSGRRTAAQVLLYDLASPFGTLHELLPETEDGRSRLSTDHIGAGDQLWLDLSTANGVLWDQVQGELSSFRATVLERSAYLVVILPETRELRNEFEGLLVEIGRLSEKRVLEKHLKISEIDLGQDTHLPPEVAENLAGQPSMQRTADIASLIRRARDQGQPKEGPADWCRRACVAIADQSAQVTDLLGKHQSGFQRALLLTVAMLHEAPSHDIQVATELLLQTTEHPPNDLPLLVQDDLAARLQEIGATEDRFGRVCFRELGYDRAIQIHYWNKRPDLRSHLINWIDGAIRSPDLTERSRDGLAERLAEQCLRGRYPNDWSTLIDLVLEWTTNERRGLLPQAADRVLRYGLEHEEAASVFRRKIYEWSQESRLSKCLVGVLVAMCSEVIAKRHPEQAVVRLHHLTRRQRGLPMPREALLRLVADSQSLRRLMFSRLAMTFGQGKGSDRARWEVDTTLFLALSIPTALVRSPDRLAGPLLDEPSVRDHLAACWNGVLTEDQVIGTERIGSWLDEAADAQRYREVILDLLVTACDRQVGILARLYGVACLWADTADTSTYQARSHIRVQLLRKIHTARSRVAH
ncbi:hypothetical protein FF36_02515 [Frankia torreyi]|uniref:Novel STAND NTPase 3 domain-containing protein n=1 Tax=Frankia torreyi TaxID=1856 RepID=A0A0D8BI16_9ACTN|nr:MULTISPECIES: hypothetical protein [Frankia]KJE23087.1 hypothetical protein FF36_02515 [Frankia torreyi]